MKRRIAFTTAIILCCAVFTTLATPQAARAQKHRVCSNATLQGSYAVRATGNVPSGPTAGPLAFVGLFTYDGDGGLLGKLTIRLNDVTNGPTTMIANYQGSYIVNADCTFKETWNNLAGGFALHAVCDRESEPGQRAKSCRYSFAFVQSRDERTRCMEWSEQQHGSLLW